MGVPRFCESADVTGVLVGRHIPEEKQSNMTVLKRLRLSLSIKEKWLLMGGRESFSPIK